MPNIESSVQIRASNVTPNCMLCPTRTSCLINGVCDADIKQWNSLVHHYVTLPTAGKALIHSGEDASSIYIVRAGCLKSCTSDEQGDERVRGFHLPGDVIGLDSLGSNVNPCDVVAVVPSQVCRLSKNEVLRLFSTNPALMQRLLDRTSRELGQALTLAGNFSAEERVAVFLLSIQRRLGSPSGTVRLPMPRRDIANYLRLATETVCRVITRFEAKGWMVSEDKKLTLKRIDELRRVSAAMPLMAALSAA